MKAKDLRARSTSELTELCGTLKKDLFSSRMKNFTSQLEDTSKLGKARREIARVETILRERAAAPASSGGEAS